MVPFAGFFIHFLKKSFTLCVSRNTHVAISATVIISISTIVLPLVILIGSILFLSMQKRTKKHGPHGGGAGANPTVGKSNTCSVSNENSAGVSTHYQNGVNKNAGNNIKHGAANINLENVHNNKKTTAIQ